MDAFQGDEHFFKKQLFNFLLMEAKETNEMNSSLSTLKNS